MYIYVYICMNIYVCICKYNIYNIYIYNIYIIYIYIYNKKQKQKLFFENISATAFVNPSPITHFSCKLQSPVIFHFFPAMHQIIIKESFPIINTNVRCQPGLPNFRRAMAIRVRALENENSMV